MGKVRLCSKNGVENKMRLVTKNKVTYLYITCTNPVNFKPNLLGLLKTEDGTDKALWNE